MYKKLRFLTTLLLLAVSVSTWAETSTLNFTTKCNGSGTADDGVVWTVTSDGTESTFDNSKGIHYGTNSAQVTYIKLSTSGISGTITKVVVNASTASGVSATASVTVGGNAFGGDAQSLSTTATDYTFEGSASGAIEVTVTKPSKAAKALYVKSIAVTYSTGGGTTTVAAPTFSPAAGAVAYGTSVTLTQASAYMINYTTDGSEPTWDNGVDFATHPITITSDVTIKARAYDIDQNASAIVTAAYTVERPAAPTFSPAAGAVEAGTPVTISGTGRIIVYTTDGSTPSYSDNGVVYTDPITVNEAMTIKAIVVDSHDFESEVATASYTIYDPNAPGTESNPYTVAQARAAIDAGTGKTGVYATGIVSAIPTAYSTQYSNITFNFVDEEGDTEYLQAYRCGGDKAANVQVGDIVVVYGNLTKYNSTYEFGQGCQLVSLTHPAAAVEIPTFSPAAGTYTEAQNVTISCETTGATIYYTTDGTDPTTSSTQYTEAIAVSQTMTIKAIAVNGNDESSVAAATYHINSQDNPYTVAQALAFNEYPANNIYVHGIVSTAPTSLNSDGTLTYYISDNGEATNKLEVYKGKDLENADFDAVEDIQVGDIVTIYGNVKIYNGTKEFENGNYLVSFERPASTEPSISVANNNINVTAEDGEGTINVTYENISEVAAEIAFFEEDGTTAATYDWITADINDNNNIEYLINANDGEARSAYMKVWAYDDDLNAVYSELITITQAAYVAPVIPTGNSYVKVTSTDDITTGQYLIVYEGDETHSAVAFNGGLETLDAVSNTIGVTIENNEIAATTATEAAEFTIDVTDGSIKSASGYFIGQTSDANGMNTSTETAYTNTISIDGEGYAVILASGGAYLRYNSASNQERFRYYKSTSYTNQKAIQLYKKVAAVTPEVTFSEEDDTDSKIDANNGKTVNATLTRTLSSEYWSTFSVPFNVTADQVTAVLGEGVELRKFQGSEGTVIKFQEATAIEAGYAYLVKPAVTVTNPVFEGVTVVNTIGEMDADDNNYGFVGAVIKTKLATDQTELFLGTDGKFYYPESDAVATMKGLRGYFMVPAGTEPSKLSVDVNGSGIATSINSMNIEGMGDGNIYNLNGQRVNAPQKGLYIVNGKKVIIK